MKLNHAAIVTRFLLDKFTSHPLVNTTIYGDPSESEVGKSTIFPLVNVVDDGWNTNGNRFDFTFTIRVADIRDIQFNTTNNKLFGDNRIDNKDETFGILAYVLTTLELQRNPDDILLESASGPKPLDFFGTTLIDGYETTIVLSIFNDICTC